MPNARVESWEKNLQKTRKCSIHILRGTLNVQQSQGFIN